MKSPEIWLPLRNQLLILLNHGYQLEQLLIVGLARDVVLTCVGDVLPQEIEAQIVRQDENKGAESEIPVDPLCDRENGLPGLALSTADEKNDDLGRGTSPRVQENDSLGMALSSGDKVNGSITGALLPGNTEDDSLGEALSTGAGQSNDRAANNGDHLLMLDHSMAMSPISEDDDFPQSPRGESPVSDSTREKSKAPLSPASLDMFPTVLQEDEEEEEEEGEIRESPVHDSLPSLSIGSDSDMDIEEGASFIQIIDGVWGTLKAGSNGRVRPSAADLNGHSSYSAGYAQPPRGLFRERQQNYVIDLSDSEEEKIKSGQTTPALLPQKGSSGNVKERMQELERQKKELQEKMKSLAAKRRGGPVRACATPEVHGPSKSSSDAPDRTQSLSTTLIAEPAPTVSEALPGSRVVAEVNASTTTMTETVEDTASGVLAMMAAARQSRKKELEAAIKAEEASLCAIQKEVIESEQSISQASTGLQEAQEKRIQVEAALATRKEQVASLVQQIAEDEATRLALSETEKQLANELAILRRGILGKGNLIPDMHQSISSKRAELVELALQADGGKTGRNTNKRVNSDQETIAAKRTKVSSLPEDLLTPSKYDEDFILFLRSALSNSEALRASSGDAPDIPSTFPESHKGDALRDVFRTENVSLHPLMNVGGYLRTTNDIASMSDAYGTQFPVNGWWNNRGFGSEISNATETSGSAKNQRLASYTSNLTQFRSFRLNKGYDKDMKSLTWSNKVAPFQKLCRFETEGGVCHDADCKGQHFRDIGMSDDEVIVDLMSYTADKDRTEASSNGLQNDLQAVSSKGPPLAHLARAIAHHQKASDQDDVISLAMNRQHTAKQKNSRKLSIVATDQATVSDNEFGEIRPKGLVPPTTRKPSVLPRVPVLIDGLRKILDKDQTRLGRYFQESRSEQELEEVVIKHPRNAEAWIEYAAATIPADLTYEDISKTSTQLNKPLNVLSRALQANRKSEAIWDFYLEIYCRCGSESDTRETFQQAVHFVPVGITLWWRWYLWETDRKAKAAVVEKMAISFLMDRASTKRDVLLDAAVQLVKLFVDDGQLRTAQNWLWVILTGTSLEQINGFSTVIDDAPLYTNEPPLVSQTVAFSKLSSADLGLGWLLYIHLQYHGSLPEGVFHNYPYNHLLRRQFWEIDWNAGRPDAISAGLIEHIHRIFEHVVSSWATLPVADQKLPYITILRNYCNFMGRVLQKTTNDVRIFLLTCMKQRANMTDIWELHAMQEKNFGEPSMAIQAIKMYLQRAPEEFSLWNLYAKFALRDGKLEEVILALVNGIRAAFVGLSDLKQIKSDELLNTVEEALLLYRKVLALHIPSLRAPDVHPHLSRSFLRSNVYLWLNYLLLQTLRLSADESPRDLRSALDHAVEAVKDADSRKLLWMEYIRFELARKPSSIVVAAQSISTKDALTIISRSVKDIKVDSLTHPGIPEKISVEFMTPVPLRDLTLPHQLFRILMDRLPREKQLEIVELVAEGQLPLGAIPLTAQAALDNPATCLKILYKALTINPKSATLWRMITVIEYLNGNPLQAQLVFRTAITYFERL
ncbi:hypothetical protein PhCBS80983_g02652 [Powellomyces hirtus]|uniref:Putative zinc-finger domain-containing protein n=1 Tax=Powellomyces hirtus TaxID=109895 RepID=A0A507E4Z6_9FUNG|nr:hypothetical protein PhCBS80983_g02652 [Powellomyces hirtus]